MLKFAIGCLFAGSVLVAGITVACMSNVRNDHITYRCDGRIPTEHTVTVVIENGKPVGYRDAMGRRVELPAECWPLTAGPVIREK